MKKFLLTLTILLTLSSFNIFASEGDVVNAILDESIQISIDNRWGVIRYDEEEKDPDGHIWNEKARALIVDGKTYLPIRGIAYSLYKDVEYDKQTKRVVIIDRYKDPGIGGVTLAYQGPRKVKATRVRASIWWGDKEIIGASNKAYLYKDRVYVPVRETITALGYRVDWDAKNRRVLVFDKMTGPYKGEAKYYGYTKEDYDYIMNKYGYVNTQGEIWGNPKNNYRVQTFVDIVEYSKIPNQKLGIFLFEENKIGKSYTEIPHFSETENYVKCYAKKWTVDELGWKEGDRLYEDDLFHGMVVAKRQDTPGIHSTEYYPWAYMSGYPLTPPIISPVLLKGPYGSNSVQTFTQLNIYPSSEYSLIAGIGSYGYYTVILADPDPEHNYED